MRHRRGGFSLIEIVIVLAITAVILVATFMVIFSVTRGNESMAPRIKLQLEATRVLREMCALLKTSGPQEFIVPGTTPPKGDGIWEPGEYPAFAVYTPSSGLGPKWAPPYDFLNANNASITPNAPPTDTDIYPPYILDANAAVNLQTSEIAFRVPKNVDPIPVNPIPGIKSAPYPTDFTTGQVEWGTDILAIVLVPGGFGNELQMRWYDATTLKMVRSVVLSRDVERILFQAFPNPPPPLPPTFYQTNNFDQTLQGPDEMRVTLWFWTKDINGNIVKLKQTATFNFRSITR